MAATQVPQQTYGGLNGPGGLVQNQVQNIIDRNSPLMQRAAARANTQSSARGMLNSSMGIGAAQGAVMDAAVPIATSDANSINTSQDAQRQQANSALVSSTTEFNRQRAAIQESDKMDTTAKTAAIKDLTTTQTGLMTSLTGLGIDGLLNFNTKVGVANTPSAASALATATPAAPATTPAAPATPPPITLAEWKERKQQIEDDYDMVDGGSSTMQGAKDRRAKALAQLGPMPKN